jgi:hypothetical protein
MTSKPHIPVLTDIISSHEALKTDAEIEAEIFRTDCEVVINPSRPAIDLETLIAELQTKLASSAFTLTEEILRSSLAEMEANLYEQVSARLRRELPELIDTMLREHLAQR